LFSKKKKALHPRDKNLITGKVIGHPDGFGWVSAKPTDVYLNRHEMRLVLPGDEVVVRPSQADHRGRIEGAIVEVVKRSNESLVGQLVAGQGQNYVRPDDPKFSQDIIVDEGNLGNARHGQMVVVGLIDQPSPHSPPRGKVLEILGDKMDPGVEIQVAIRRFGIPNEWPKGASSAAKKLGAEVAESDKANRLDLRDTPTITIDGADARDFDDAVHCEKSGSGWILRVAIADVSHYVHPGSTLDQEAEKRGTSVYFPDHVVPMLPEEISNGLCSLNPEVDRLTLVCEMQIDGAGKVTKYKFAEAVIRSHARLTYDQVFAVIEGKGDGRAQAMKKQVLALHELYKVLLKARYERGALDFDSTETRVIFDGNRKIEQIVPTQRNDAHRLIEECMLCANICAADFLESHKLPGLYRVHDTPKSERLDGLRDFLSNIGLWLGGGEKPKPMDFKKLTDQIGNRPDRHLIEMQILRAQQQAVYQPENNGHFGLAYDAYAHFTSPIRRYPDLLVHRAIRSIIRSDKKSSRVLRFPRAKTLKKTAIYPYDLEQMEKLGEHCSMAERRAEEASRDVLQWLKCEFLLDRVGETFPAIVATITPFGLFAELEGLYIEGLVHITALPKDYYDHDPVAHKLIGRKTRRIFGLGDRALVQVARVSLDERKIDLVLADSNENRSRDKRAPHKGKEAGGGGARNKKGRRQKPRGRKKQR
jgi:ribonuclease R